MSRPLARATTWEAAPGHLAPTCVTGPPPRKEKGRRWTPRRCPERAAHSPPRPNARMRLGHQEGAQGEQERDEDGVGRCAWGRCQLFRTLRFQTGTT